MLSYFCPKCGGKNLYQFQKPKFCSNCGANFTLASTNVVSNIKSTKFEVNIDNNKKTNQHINIDNDCEDFEQQPVQNYSSMRGLDVHIERHNQSSGIKLGELVSDEPVRQIAANKKITKQRRGKKKIAKSLPASFVSEAKMSGRNNQNYEEPNIVDNEE